MASSPRFDVAVIGGGFSGLAAAARLAASGRRVLVLEARPALGGRASSFTDPATGEVVDNGQHLMLGCYHETFAFLRLVGAERNVRVQASLEVPFVDPEGRRSLLRCPPLPSPLHLLAGLLDWEALGMSDRLSALGLAGPLRRAQRHARTGRGLLPASESETVEAWLIRCGQSQRLRDMLWEPLAVAALNQPIQEAAAPVFVRVLGQMLGRDARDAAVAIPLMPLSAMYAEPAADYIRRHGGEVRTSSPARIVVGGGAVDRVEVRGDTVHAGDVILAAAWFAWPDILCGELSRLQPILDAARRTAASPIVTVNLWLDRAVLDRPFLGLPGRTFQWVFDKQQLVGGGASHLSFVSSGAEAVVARSNDELAALAHEELVWAVPGARQAKVVRRVVVREKRATFSLSPGQPDRPSSETAVRGLWFAGDWVQTGLPATIEGAVVSGHRAADGVLDSAAVRNAD